MIGITYLFGSTPLLLVSLKLHFPQNQITYSLCSWYFGIESGMREENPCYIFSKFTKPFLNYPSQSWTQFQTGGPKNTVSQKTFYYFDFSTRTQNNSLTPRPFQNNINLGLTSYTKLDSGEGALFSLKFKKIRFTRWRSTKINTDYIKSPYISD
jgi:hypothetical protein